MYMIFFQLKYKRRVYKMLHMDEKQLKAINSKASRKKFIDHVNNNNVDKVNKMCAKGLDPNFHCQDSNNGGESKKDDDSNSSPSSLNFKSLRLMIRNFYQSG